MVIIRNSLSALVLGIVSWAFVTAPVFAANSHTILDPREINDFYSGYDIREITFTLHTAGTLHPDESLTAEIFPYGVPGDTDGDGDPDASSSTVIDDPGVGRFEFLRLDMECGAVDVSEGCEPNVIMIYTNNALQVHNLLTAVDLTPLVTFNVLADRYVLTITDLMAFKMAMGILPNGSVNFGAFSLVASFADNQVDDLIPDSGICELVQLEPSLPPAPCNISVEKTCFVVGSNILPYNCTKPIDTLTFVWDGVELVNGVTVKAYKGDPSTELLDTVENVEVGTEVKVTGYAGSPNDVYFEIFDSSLGDYQIGTSIFHLSCSDQDMNGPEDCTARQGDGKSNDAGLLNDWLLEGIVDAGGELDCTVDSPASEETKCVVISREGALCTKRPTSISFRYHDEYTCMASDNSQPEDKTSCDDPGANSAPVRIVVSKDDGTNVTLDTGPGATVEDGDVVVALAADAGLTDFDSSSRIQILDDNDNLLQDITLHTSCSQPLAIGDYYGAMEVVAFENSEQGEVQVGAEVQYTYDVTNNNIFNISDILLTDNEVDLSTVDGNPIALLESGGGSDSLMASVFVEDDVTNTVWARGTGADGQVCEGSASAEVEVKPYEPPPCVIEAEPGIKLSKKKLEWKVQNVGAEPAVIKQIEISWPDGTNGFLDRIKIGKKEIVKDDQPASPASITEFNGSVSDRTIKLGKAKTIKFEFEHNVDKSPADYEITIIFEEGCEIFFDGDDPNAPFACSNAKPIDSLSMIWNGQDPVDVTSGTLEAEVIPGQIVTFDGLSGMGNDVFWTVSGTPAETGTSRFHLSCSDREMNGPEDCGKPEGDGKDNNSSYLNLWLFEGMKGTNDISLDCSALP
jgi:hypothetical protein